MDIWKHGKYFDTWSVVHFLSGFLLALTFYKLGFEFLSATIISFVVILVWEAVEWVAKIIEPSPNVLADIILGLLGFFLGASYYYISLRPFDWALFISVLVFTLSLSTWGLVDFLKRGYR